MDTLWANLTSGSMVFLIRQTLIYAVPLMIVALAGIYAERSGVINLALEGHMIFGAFIGVLFVRLVQPPRGTAWSKCLSCAMER